MPDFKLISVICRLSALATGDSRASADARSWLYTLADISGSATEWSWETPSLHALAVEQAAERAQNWLNEIYPCR